MVARTLYAGNALGWRRRRLLFGMLFQIVSERDVPNPIPAPKFPNMNMSQAAIINFLVGYQIISCIGVLKELKVIVGFQFNI